MTVCLGEMREDLFPSVDKELCTIGRVVELEVTAYGEVPSLLSSLTSLQPVHSWLVLPG